MASSQPITFSQDGDRAAERLLGPNFWSLATNISLFVILCCGGLEKTSPSIKSQNNSIGCINSRHACKSWLSYGRMPRVGEFSKRTLYVLYVKPLTFTTSFCVHCFKNYLETHTSKHKSTPVLQTVNQQKSAR